MLSSPELIALLGAAGLLWSLTIVQTIEHLRSHGVRYTVGNRKNFSEQPSGYAGRLHRLVRNHVEGMAVFTPLVFAVLMLDASDVYTQIGAQMVFGGWVLHALLYALGIPLLRLIVFIGLIDLGYVLIAFGLYELLV